MKTKSIPAIITLIAGFITCIISFVNQLSMGQFIKILLLVIVGFYILGCIIKFVFDRNFPLEENEVQEQEEADAEGTEDEASGETKDAAQETETTNATLQNEAEE